MNVAQAYAALVEALATVEGARGYDDPGANLDPPATIVGPPLLEYAGAPGPDPVNGKFLVVLAVVSDERAMVRLWELLPRVIDAIESVGPAVVGQASPGTWRTGATDLPCYEIQVEMSLS